MNDKRDERLWAPSPKPNPGQAPMFAGIHERGVDGSESHSKDSHHSMDSKAEHKEKAKPTMTKISSESKAATTKAPKSPSQSESGKQDKVVDHEKEPAPERRSPSDKKKEKAKPLHPTKGKKPKEPKPVWPEHSKHLAEAQAEKEFQKADAERKAKLTPEQRAANEKAQMEFDAKEQGLDYEHEYPKAGPGDME
jgi:hypothetical protein